MKPRFSSFNHRSATALVALWSIVFGTTCGCRRPGKAPNDGAEQDRGSARRPALFEEMGADVGLDFVHDPGRPGTWYYPEIMVMGAALLDYDCDGDLDIYLLNCGAPIMPGVARDPADATNRLFRQESNGHFVDVTAASGLGDQGYGVGVAVGDINNDGYPDIYVTNVGLDRLFLNEGNGHFRDITKQAGVSNSRWSAAACFVDYDRDGWLDLYVSNYVDYFPSRKCYGPSGRRDYCGPGSFEKTVDRLWHNISGQTAPDHLAHARADGIRFEDASVTAGIAKRRGSGLGVLAIDFNNDGWQDIYVANDMVANFLWVNQQDGTFADDALLQGVAYDAQGRPQASMGVGVTDINDDQLPDLYVSHMVGEMNAFYESAGENVFREAAMEHGLCAPLHPWTTFGFAFFDIDHDGDEDLAVVNGSMKLPDEAVKMPDFEDRAAYWRIFSEPNMILMNNGHGKYQVRHSANERFTTRRETSRALCMGDIDNDGDIDMLVASTAAKARLYRNVAPKKGHWLRLRAVEPKLGGRDAYGARITVLAGKRRWTRWVSPGGSYLSSNDPIVHVGLGPIQHVDAITIRWPDGSTESFAGHDADQLLVLAHGTGAPQ